MNAVQFALLRFAVSLDRNELEDIDWRGQITKHLPMILKSNVPGSLAGLREEQLTRLIAKIGIVGLDQMIYAKAYMKYIANSRLALTTHKLMQIAEVQEEVSVKRTAEIESRTQRIFQMLEVNSWDEAIKTCEELGKHELAVEIRDWLELWEEFDSTGTKKHIESLRKLVDDYFSAAYDSYMVINVFEIYTSNKSLRPKILWRNIVRSLLGFANHQDLMRTKIVIEAYFEVEQHQADIMILANQ